MDLVKLKVIINHKEHIIPQIHNKITFIKIPASWLAFQTRKGSKINFFQILQSKFGRGQQEMKITYNFRHSNFRSRSN